MLQRYYRSIVALILDKELTVVQLSDGDDWGLYAAEAVNHFNTPLMVRGTKADVENFMEQHRLPRDV